MPTIDDINDGIDPTSSCVTSSGLVSDVNFAAGTELGIVSVESEILLTIHNTGKIEFNKERTLDEITYKFQENCNQKYLEMKNERDIAKDELNTLRNLFKDFYDGKIKVEDLSEVLKLEKSRVEKCFHELKKEILKRYNYIQKSEIR